MRLYRWRSFRVKDKLRSQQNLNLITGDSFFHTKSAGSFPLYWASFLCIWTWVSSRMKLRATHFKYRLVLETPSCIDAVQNNFSFSVLFCDLWLFLERSLNAPWPKNMCSCRICFILTKKLFINNSTARPISLHQWKWSQSMWYFLKWFLFVYPLKRSY